MKRKIISLIIVMISVISLFGCGKTPVAMPLSVSSEKHQTEMINDIDGDIRIDEGNDIEINTVCIGFDLEDVLFSHGIAAGVFDDRNRAFHFAQFHVVVNGHASPGVDVVKHDAVFNFSYIQHIIDLL